MIAAISNIETTSLGSMTAGTGAAQFVPDDDGFAEALRQVRERMESGSAIPTVTDVSRSPLAPYGTVQTVKRGDTLSGLCREKLRAAGLGFDNAEVYRLVDKVARLNRISDPDKIRAGQRLDLSPVLSSTKTLATTSGGGAQEETVAPWRGVVGDRAELSSGYGVRRDPFTRQLTRHEGIDLACAAGTPVYAAAEGKVSFSGWQPGYGKVVVLTHADGSETVYAHASRLTVRAGDEVESGAKIAAVGTSGRSTGPHLHFEVRRGRGSVDPISYLSEHESGRLASLGR